MVTFKDREKALENKYFHNEELKFRISSRRRKLLGLWAAEKMHLDEEASLNYALDIVKYGIQDPKEGAVVKRILSDMAAKGIDLTEQDVRDQMQEFHDTAEEMILSEYKNTL